MRSPRALLVASLALAALGGCGSGDTIGSGTHGADGHGAGGHGSPTTAPPAGAPVAPGASPTPAATTIEVEMVDHAYRPATVTIPAGTPVTLRFVNRGTVRHEAVIGDEAGQRDHHGGPMAHGDGVPAVTVEPGGTAELTYTAGGSPGILIGCHEPGHWEAGMKATIVSG